MKRLPARRKISFSTMFALIPRICFVNGKRAPLTFSPPCAFSLPPPMKSKWVINDRQHAMRRFSETTTSESVTAGDAVSVIDEFRVPMKVYIEDTDAYGVMYYGNYLRSFERALHHAKEDNVGDWCVTNIEQQKFRLSPLLGQSFVIEGKRIESDVDGSQRESWSVTMAKKRSTDSKKEDHGRATIYNSAVLTISHPSLTPWVPPLAVPVGKGFSVNCEYSFMTYPDEHDINFPHRITLRSALNYFERSRSSWLGGPDALRRMKEDDGVIWVIASVDEATIVEDDNESNVEPATAWKPGDNVIVKSTMTFRRKGIVECRQTLFSPTGTSSQNGDVPMKRLAQAILTVWALDEKSRRPTSPPQWLLEKLNYTS